MPKDSTTQDNITRKINRAPITMLAMILAVVGVYWCPDKPGSAQLGLDYQELHRIRMHFAWDALRGNAHSLPGWYPRELLGTPFWSNIQNFPFIPTRLLVLFTLDPDGPYTYCLASTLAAVLAAVFTYLFARKIGLADIASAGAGWTFACNGFFAARVAAGHLPLLEAYCALPLLLWASESLLQALSTGNRRKVNRRIIVLGLSTTCVLLAGHPQIPIYALTAAAIYILFRSGFSSASLRAWISMIIGAGCAAFALLPMAMLVHRSTRILSLALADNDLTLPYGRLMGFLFPWLDGAPPPLDRSESNPFHGYPHWGYFWDTFCYAGWMPWIAVLFLVGFAYFSRKQRRINRITLFVIVLGLAGILLALPLIRQLTGHLPWTLLRSPSRLLYWTEFSLAMALGAAVQVLIRTAAPVKHAWLIVAIGLTVHCIDLAYSSRQFIIRTGDDWTNASKILQPPLAQIGDQRVAIDYSLPLSFNRMFDDIGFFDSILLAKPYQALLDLSGLHANLNIQNLRGGQLRPRALEATGVDLVFTTVDRHDLTFLSKYGPVFVFKTIHPNPRTLLIDDSAVHYVDQEQIHRRLRDLRSSLTEVMLVPSEYAPAPEHAASSQVNTTSDSNQKPSIEYHRQSSDVIDCTVTSPRAGFLRLIESWDPGWSATVDQKPASVVPAWDVFLAVPIPQGTHKVQLIYHTPGARGGLVISLLCIGLLLAYAAWPDQRLTSIPPTGQPA